jgi:Cu(I)/Ag(I) efflux system membrane fusion protein
MNPLRILTSLALSAGIGLGGYWSFERGHSTFHADLAAPAAATDRLPLYYRNPSGATLWSASPKKDPQGRDYVPVYEEDGPAAEPANAKSQRAETSRKILYYRNPMGLPDTSRVPKQDSMGMDYIPVYEGEDTDNGSVKLSPGKIQRTGARSEPVVRRPVTSLIRGPGDRPGGRKTRLGGRTAL